jgi:hypothetical protein
LRIVSSEERVAVVIRPLDNALAVLRLALVPVAAAVASLPVIQTFTRSFPEASRHWLMLATACAVLVAGVMLLQTQPIGSRVDRALARIRRRVAMACNHTAGVTHDDGRVACMLTPQILRAPVFPYDEQSAAVSKLTHACGGDPPGGFWFIEGDSGSGKTRAALRFVQSLVRDRELFELGSRCYLYDFSESTDKQTELTSQLGGPRLDDAVVLIDNFQLVQPPVLRALTQYLMDQGARKSERLVVFLTRPGDVWNLDHGSDVQLLSTAKAENCHVELFGPSAEIVARRVAELDREAARQIEDLQQGPIASAAQLHFAQTIVHNRAATPELSAILRLLTGQADTREARRLVDVVALVTALSVHRGGFSRRDLRHALSPLTHGLAPRQRPSHVLRVWTTFRRLHKVGFVTKLELGRTRYVFHEAIAELCVDRLWGVPEFKASFAAVACPRLRRHVKAGEWFSAWLVAAELDDQELLLRAFDAALSQGAYLRMLRCLERARKRYELSETSRLQLGILLNRTGRFIKSRAVFRDDLPQALRTSDELAAMLATSRMEATHDAADEAKLSVLVRHPDRFVAIVGEYWQRHMAMHRGEFDAERMLELANEAFELIAGRDGYWSTYSLARMHFDSLRHHYLMGGEPIAAISTPERRRVGAYLSERLATYEALHMLYTKAHVAGHVLLPQRAIFRASIGVEDAKQAGVRPAERDSIDSLVKTAQLLYRHTTDEFWQYGDREAQYLQADILNAEMIEQGVALDAFADRLSDYRDFGAANFKLVRSYPHFYTLRWHMLRYYDASEDARSDPAADLSAAHRHLERVIHFDTEARNHYGVVRGRLLGVLLRAVKQPLSACERELHQLHPEMLRCRYGFEAKLIAHLLERDGLHPEQLRLIFRFYPFVHQ